MPQNSPRGYTYPCYSDPVNFPAQMQDLAQDIDADVQAILNDISDARNTPPSARVSGTTNVATVAGTAQTVTFQTEEYDNAAMFTAPSSTITVPVEGLYLISSRIVFASGTAGQKSIFMTVNGIGRAGQTRQSNAGFTTTVNVHVLTFCPAAATIQTIVETTAASSYTTRLMTVTRVTGTTLL